MPIDKEALPPRRGFLSFTTSAFAGTLTVLIFHKAAQIANSLSSFEPFSKPLHLIPQSIFFLGWDIIGALAWAILIGLLAWPLQRFLHRRAGWTLAVVLLLAHGLFLGIGYFVNQGSGAPIDKAAIKLGLFFRDPEATGSSGSAKAVWDSVSHFFTAANFLFIAVCTFLGPVVFLLIEGRSFKPARWLRRVMASSLAVFTLLTLVVLPLLINGEWGRAHVRTFGLERSPVVTFARSYWRPRWRRLASPPVPLGDPYCLDFSSIVGPPRLERNPLWREGRPAEAEGDAPIPRRTNVVFVILESIGAVYLDEDPARMPFLREFGASPGSVKFAAHYCPWPQTMQAVFSLMCSEMPYPDYAPITLVNPDIPCVSLSEALKSAGYATGLFGSQDLSYESQSRFFRHRSFDRIADMNSLPGREGAWANSWGIDEAVTIRAMVEWMAEAKQADPDRPIFAYYNMAAGHHPYVYAGGPPPPEAVVSAERQAYIGCLGYVDRCLRQLSDSLKANAGLGETLLVIVGDHGEAFSQHGVRAHGTQVYDEQTRVPWVMSGPQLEGLRGSADFVTDDLDVAPTILGLLGLEPPATMKGRDLTRSRDVRVAIFGARTPDEPVGIRDGRWKAIRSEETGLVRLFDLAADPGETVDVAAGHRDLADRLIARARSWKVHSLNLIENYAAILKAGGRRCVPAPPSSD